MTPLLKKDSPLPNGRVDLSISGKIPLSLLTVHTILRLQACLGNIYYQQFAAVKDIAPQNSVMITDRSDKIFFPYYKVVVPQGDLPLFERLDNIVVYANIYYFTDKKFEDIDLSPLQITEEHIINNNFKLYKVSK